MAGLNTLARVALCRSPVGEALRRVPGLERAYARRMLNSERKPGLFAGCYATYGEAMAAIPPGRVAGWDNTGCADIFNGPLPNQPSAHAVFFWLSRLLEAGARLVDYGGGPGVTYRLYAQRATSPVGVTWTVVDLPAIVARGREVAAAGTLEGIAFAETLAEAGPCDILLSAGALQYMEHSIPGLLASLATKPRHIILNKVPLTSGAAYWSLQNQGPAVCPYRIYNAADFLAYFEAEGYTVADRWRVAELTCDIPFHPRRSIDEQCGFLFSRP
ncbi:methyltransferase, TIGR04325 family [Plastoroseomonas arctica]|uniref:Methyltransferase, TIGR04325 family n=1 Tax=Plastoroseomonas arctica TaxID=1509237 RepID=A0AAF1KN41_9PROT|nr:methyltransferase, TIGR04325 family [Plastoroseomonas arctica]MBR0657131.1 methyltransferase, TIGR04325 family [Plastoroseomonas arctica]